MHKSKLVGIFLAVLELVRHHHIRVEQNTLFGEIWILPNRPAPAPLDLSNVDEYEHAGKRDRWIRDQKSEISDQRPDPNYNLSFRRSLIPNP